MFCMHCGKPMPDDAQLCPDCGRDQSVETPAPAQQVAVKPGLSRGALIAIIAAVLFFPMLAVLGIIAAIAIPAYQDYTHRAKVAGALAQVAPVKLAYAEHVLTEGELPRSLADLGVTLTPQPPMRTLTLNDGLLVIEFDDSMQHGTLALEPWQDADSQLLYWLCGESDHVSGMGSSNLTALTESNAADHTSINSTWLPSSCR